jgi:hypothetical protein
LSVTVTFAVLVPVCVGVKITEKLHVPLGATSVPLQVSLAKAKSPEDTTTLVTLSGTTLGLVKVTVCAALGTSIGWRPKLRCVGE